MDSEKRRRALEELAERMNRDIPGVVADNLHGDMLEMAYVVGGEENWKSVEDDARRLLNVFRGAPSPPGRGEREAPPVEIAVAPDADTARREEAFAEVAAMMADEHPKVKKFRRRHLRDGLLSDEEAREFFDGQGGPYGTGSDLKKLLKLARELRDTYVWREGDAAWFVLTGHVPPVRALEVGGYVRQSNYPGVERKFLKPERYYSPGESEAWFVMPDHVAPVKVLPRLTHRKELYLAEAPAASEYLPNTARITVTAFAWMKPGEVERAFREAQSQILDGGDAARNMPERTSEAVRFVSRRMREHGEETWEARKEAWNRTQRKSWHYRTYKGLRQVFERFFGEYVRRTYETTNYRPAPESPYETYIRDAEDRDAV